MAEPLTLYKLIILYMLEKVDFPTEAADIDVREKEGRKAGPRVDLHHIMEVARGTAKPTVLWGKQWGRGSAIRGGRCVTWQPSGGP